MRIVNNFFRQVAQFLCGDPSAQLSKVAQAEEPKPCIKNGESMYSSIYFTYPPGHYYSPLPDPNEIKYDESRIFSSSNEDILGIDLNTTAMLSLLSKMKNYAADFKFPDVQKPSARFYLDNGIYSKGDALTYYSIIRIFKPKRIFEIGSGLSTCLALDINERFFKNTILLTTIDPYPERMLAMLWPNDESLIHVIKQKAQAVESAHFNSLKENDILFIDSSHVCKCGSDINYILFDVLPRLKPGVIIHFHDIFFPFEYPKSWLLDIGVAWNETYFLRAFLQYNPAFEIIFFSDYLANFYRRNLEESIPQFLEGSGSSIWIRKK